VILASETGATPFFLVIIKPRANLQVQANATLRVICTVLYYLNFSLMHSRHFKKSPDFSDEMFDLLFFNIVTLTGTDCGL